MAELKKAEAHFANVKSEIYGMRKELDKTGTIFSRFIGHLPGVLTAYLGGSQISSRRDCFFCP